MMAENPNWWSMQQQQKQQLPSSSSMLSSTVMPSQYILGSSSPPLSNNSMDDNKDLPNSWSQLLMGGLSGGCDEYRFGMSHFQQRKLENWEEHNIPNPCMRFPVFDVKQEVSYNQDREICGQGDEEFQALRPPLAAAWSPQVLPVSSPRSCVTTSSTNSNILKFSNKADEDNHHHYLPDISSESNSTASGGITKKPRVQASSSQPLLKVRKEKLGDRITALHQLVSPFGKTDTASVLLEAIGYIRFLQGQIEALSSPYLDSASSNMRSQHSDNQDTQKNLRSRGLCLVPISCTQQVDNDNGADYWAPSFGGGF